MVLSLFGAEDIARINEAAKKSTALTSPIKPVSSKGMSEELERISGVVSEYFKDSSAILITTLEQLHEYVDDCISYGYAGIDTETTGLDRLNDVIVGASLYVPGRPECYIPINHRIALFDCRYSNQLTYEEVSSEFKRFQDSNIRLIFANADFDLSMIYKDLHVDLCDVCYYDVLVAWRCLKEDERDNSLKGLYNKYYLHGEGDPKKFTDFFTPKLFPFCNPEIAKLYAANDAKITFELFQWQRPYLDPSDSRCKDNHLEDISKLVWNLEFPMIKICQKLHRTGIYLDPQVAITLRSRYAKYREDEFQKLQGMVDAILRDSTASLPVKRPFHSGFEFNPNSPVHVKYLLYTVMQIPTGSSGTSTDKTVLSELNLPITNQILKVRSIDVLINTFVEKLPKSVSIDNRIHANFKQLGAATGRMCIAEDQLISTISGLKPIQNIQAGDVVISYDYVGNYVFNVVKNIWKTGENRECISICWKDNYGKLTELICTPEHPILTPAGFWKRADSLVCGDTLVHSTCSPEVIYVSNSGLHDVYDIEVENFHNFLVQGICVHNSSESPNMQNIPSHATDIRHLFRATVESTKVVDCESNEYLNEISVRVHPWEYLITLEGEKEVCKLSEQDYIELQNSENGSEFHKVKRVIEDEDVTWITLVLDVVNYEGGTSSVNYVET